ncbi:hypothetical protein [Salinactinospora qingdaonensis]|uniref:DUF732 domain-containing protein n=1 Tax=Salinactinospora qingdaonensis TaxID=702744 RepID=A0ABP7GHA0_9ACTN
MRRSVVFVLLCLFAAGCSGAVPQSESASAAESQDSAPYSSVVAEIMAGDDWWEALSQEQRTKVWESVFSVCAVADESAESGDEGDGSGSGAMNTLVMALRNVTRAGDGTAATDAAASMEEMTLAYVEQRCPEHHDRVEQVMTERHDEVFGQSG